VTIRKIRSARVEVPAETFVGQPGTIFYDEVLGTLRISDGVTPGGDRIVLAAEDINLAFGDFVASDNNLSVINVNQDLNLISNGTGRVNLVGELNVFKPNGAIGTSLAFFKIKTDGQVTIVVPTEDLFDSAVKIIGNTGSNYVPVASGLAGTMLHITGQQGQISRFYNDGISNNAAIVGRRFNGSVLAPTKILAGESIFRITALGGIDGGAPVDGTASIFFDALEDFTETNRGSQIKFVATALGALTRTSNTAATSVNEIVIGYNALGNG
jgi:hypothetical protein